jgi:hypothetical protein
MGQTTDRNTSLLKAGQASMNGSFQFDPDATSAAANAAQYGRPSPKKLEKVRQNMEGRDAIKFRANTNNRGYGFE